jgi:oxygen-dependent protoporphyrinogen oxidase
MSDTQPPSARAATTDRRPGVEDPLDLLIVGGGVSGLTLGREVLLRKPDYNVVVLESGERPGGTMRSEWVDGCLCEWGPNGFLTNVPFTRDLAVDLGLEERLLPAGEAAQDRFLWVRGALRRVPMTPPAFLKSDVLSTRGKLRMFLEPFKRGPRGDAEDTLHTFAVRRVGSEAASVLVDAMVSGIYAGDPSELSLKATFPRMAEMEERHGSLVKAMIALRRSRGKTGEKGGGPAGPGGTLTSFDLGMETLIQKLAEELGSRVRTEAKVQSMAPAPVGGYQVAATVGGTASTFFARRVVLATPAHVSRGILKEHYPRIARPLGEIPYAGVMVACLIYERDQIAHPLNGFGFLVPRGQGPRMMGCIWTSSIFPSHVRENRVLLRVMMGGARDPEGTMLSEGRTVDLAHVELQRILGRIDGPPIETRLYRHAKGIPQYVLGHLGRLRTLERELEQTPGLELTGNAYRGIGVNDCVRETQALAARMIEARTATSSEPAAVTGDRS